jgi:hypothetical protein
MSKNTATPLLNLASISLTPALMFDGCKIQVLVASVWTYWPLRGYGDRLNARCKGRNAALLKEILPRRKKQRKVPWDS